MCVLIQSGILRNDTLFYNRLSLFLTSSARFSPFYLLMSNVSLYVVFVCVSLVLKCFACIRYVGCILLYFMYSVIPEHGMFVCFHLWLHSNTFAHTNLHCLLLKFLLVDIDPQAALISDITNALSCSSTSSKPLFCLHFMICTLHKSEDIGIFAAFLLQPIISVSICDYKAT